MNDVETEITEMLQRRAGQARPQPELPPKVTRRARRHRALNAAVAGLSTAVVVAGAVVGLQAAFHGQTAPGHHGSSPKPSATRARAVGPFPGIWPDATGTDLARAQQRVDAGADQWRRGSELTAREFAIRVLGWAPAETRLSTRVISPTEERIDVWSAVVNKEVGLPLTDGSLATVITVEQLGQRGPRGVWSVTGLRSHLFTFEVGPQGRNGCPTTSLAGGKPAGMCGRATTPRAGNFIGWKVYVGPHPDIAQGEGNLLGGGFDVVQGRFGGGLTENFPRNASVLLVELVQQPAGKITGAEAMRLNLRG